MKKNKLNYIAACLILLLSSGVLQAKIWRVNKLSNYNASLSLWGDNLGGTAARPVFSELADVMASNLVSATLGDTIYMEGTTAGSGAAYSNATIFKKLVIIGAGFFLHENEHVTNDQLTTRLSSITFSASSAGSQLIGVWLVTNSGSGGHATINASNITIKRCKIDWYVSFGNGLTDILLDGNFFDNINQPTVSALDFGSSSGPGGFIVRNNIFERPVLLLVGALTGVIQECNNNVFDFPALSGGPSIKFIAGECRNNIIRSVNMQVEVNSNSSNFTHNTSAVSSQLLGTDASNVYASNINTLFVASGTSDGRYRLNAASPDNIPGSDGTERGAFGGVAVSNRYSLSGLAPVPVIYSIITAGAGSTSIPVTIKTRIIN